jgi:methyl-accepting chemotaxis protein
MLAAFGVALVVAGVAWVGFRGLNGGIDDLSTKALPSVELLARYQLAQGQLARQVTALNLRRMDAQMRAGAWGVVEAAKKEEAEARAAWEAISSFPETEAAWKAMIVQADAWERQVDASAAVLRERDQLLRANSADADRIKQLEDQAWTAFVNARESAKDLRLLQAKVAEAMRKEADAQVQAARDAGRRAGYLLLAGLVLAAAALWGLRAVLTRNIGAVFSTVRENLDAIAAGRMPEEITEARGEDFNAIRDSLNRTTGAIRALVSELGRVSAAHEQGEIDAALDPARFEGDYQAVARGVNEMVSGHVNVILRAIGVFGKFGEGNFDADLEKLPGKKRFVNEAIEQVRGNLRSLVEGAGALSAAAVAGRLDVRADAARQPGDFGRIVQGINATLDAIVPPIRELAVTLEKLAARDLRARVTGQYPGDHARLANALNGTAGALEEALGQVASAVEQVSSAATQIASSSQAVAAGASEQAASLEETGASLESASSMARQTADSAQQASALAKNARAAAGEGTSAVEGLQGSMGRVKRSAESTGQIIKDVSDIAFQTNLLALSAAVEAARAGEAGRGFAVVAEEVRSLALRAKEAAQKTEELIRQWVMVAGGGVAAAPRAAAKLGEIAGEVSKVTDVVAEIAAAAKEQTTAITQVNSAVTEMDKVTQRRRWSGSSEAFGRPAARAGLPKSVSAKLVNVHIRARPGSGGPAFSGATRPRWRPAPPAPARPPRGTRACARPRSARRASAGSAGRAR